MSSFVDVAKLDEITVGKTEAFFSECKYILVVNNDGVTSW